MPFHNDTEEIAIAFGSSWVYTWSPRGYQEKQKQKLTKKQNDKNNHDKNKQKSEILFTNKWLLRGRFIDIHGCRTAPCTTAMDAGRGTLPIPWLPQVLPKVRRVYRIFDASDNGVWLTGVPAGTMTKCQTRHAIRIQAKAYHLEPQWLHP